MHRDFLRCFHVHNDFRILNRDSDALRPSNGEKKEKNLTVKEVVENLCLGAVGGGGEHNRAQMNESLTKTRRICASWRGATSVLWILKRMLNCGIGFGNSELDCGAMYHVSHDFELLAALLVIAMWL